MSWAQVLTGCFQFIVAISIVFLGLVIAGWLIVVVIGLLIKITKWLGDLF